MAIISRTFYDVEHGGDIDQITGPINEYGGKITHQDFNYEAEQLKLVFEVDNLDKFKEAVKNEYYFDFLNK